MLSNQRRTERILREVVSDQIRLEEGAHLSITRTGVIEDHEVDFEGRHEDQDGDDNETCYSSAPMPCLLADRHAQVAKLFPQVLDGVQADKGSHE